MSQTPKPFIPEDAHRPEPGFGMALIAVGVMLVVTAILCALIYVLMIAISPLEPRKPRAATPDAPLVQPRTATPPQTAQ